MPLPDSAPLSLQVQSNLGNAVQSKPKRAMIVRMSAETLEALEAFPNHPQMSFEFGNNPGIYIGETFFPVRPQKESSPHEIYLRAASAAKPMAPLKHYANVIGKFMVERQLGEKITDKVRQQTMVAKQQHMERQAILLDQPPIPAPGAKNGKRKMPGSGTVVKKTLASDHLRVPSSSSQASRKVSPLPQNPPSARVNTDVRRRLVHCLAIAPRLAEDAVKMVGGASISVSAREDLLVLLEAVAEQQAPSRKGDKSPRPWALKPQSWTEVRPYEWPKLTEGERTTMSRQARMAFKALKIPETDPAWDNVRYRPTAPTIPPSALASQPIAASSSRSSASWASPAQTEPKRAAISAKDAKLKSKQDKTRAKGEVRMKDESSKATPTRVNVIKRVEAASDSGSATGSSGAKSVASRRLPGSGYQVKNSPQPSSGGSEKSVDTRTAQKLPLPASLPPKPVPATLPPGGSQARKTIPTVPPKISKKSDESDRERDRENDYEREREREREKRERAREREREKERERQREKAREREKEREMEIEMEKRERAREMEREREEMEREREEMEREKREQAREMEREREEMEREKRKQAREIEREREEMEREKRRREKEREREEMERERRQREKEKAREKGRIPKDRVSSVTGFKRKNATQDHEDSPDDSSAKTSIPKRRKLDDGASVVSSSSSKFRDAGLPKKPVHEPSSVPRLKIKKESTPMPPPRAPSTTQERPSNSPRPKTNGTTKARRRSPIYTSSEDEGEIPQPRKHDPSPPPISDRSNSGQSSGKESRLHSRTLYPLPTDHAALRALYHSQYGDYLGTFSKVVAQKRKIEAIINGDSDAEVDVMDPDDLTKLSMEHKTLQAELENIRQMYTKGTTDG